MIPIRNIYYLLLYAWEKLPEGEVVAVSGIDQTDILDLLASVFANSVRHVLRRGLDQSYVPMSAEVAGVRGRIQFAPTLSRMLTLHGRTFCEYDELTCDNAVNRIIRSTLLGLVSRPDLHSELRRKLLRLDSAFSTVHKIALTSLAFRQVQLQAGNGFYDFLLRLCRLIYDAVLVSEEIGEARFRKFVRNNLPALYEDFVLGFYRRERPDLRVGREDIRWMASSADKNNLAYLPRMRTDITLRGRSGCMVIDTKFYEHALTERFDAEKLISSNLYQIFSYLKNMVHRGGIDAHAEGMLLYPVVNRRLRLDYEIDGHRVRVCTLDLSDDWRGIQSELLELASHI